MKRFTALVPTTVMALLGGVGLWLSGSRDLVSVAVTETERTMLGPSVEGSAQAPLLAALGLVFLAAWGALLLTRGVVRRGLAGLAAIVGLGAAAAVVHAFLSLPAQAQAPYAELGIDKPGVAFAPWLAVAALGAALALATGVVAVLRVGSWPTMARKYDAPAAPRAATSDPANLWKSIDEGHDPTADPNP